MAWRGSLSRSLMSTARASALLSSTPLSATRRLHPSSFSTSRPNPRRLSFSNPRYLKHIVGSAQKVLEDMGLGW